VSVLWVSGDYDGSYDGAGIPPTRDAEISAFQDWRGGAIVGVVADFVVDTWAEIENPGALDNIAASAFKGTNGSGFELCVPLLPSDTSTTLAIGAAGTYNSHWTALGNHLVLNGLSARRAPTTRTGPR
jgi:hypothetical protein